MTDNYLKAQLFEMKLTEIYNKHRWLADEIPLVGFIQLFSVKYKNTTALKLGLPSSFSLTRPVF
jgi:hypothetical protein